MEKIRLSKLMAQRGICSRREADTYIEKAWVRVDGEIVSTLGTKVSPDAAIELASQAQQRQDARVTILLNKPIGYVSGQAEKEYRPAITLITRENQYRSGTDCMQFNPNQLSGLAPAGRLDIDSQGLLVLTQDGRIARQLIDANSEIEKEYLVRIEGEASDTAIQKLCHGLSLDGKPLKPAKVSLLNRDQLRFILKQGRKRQIRRMCEQVGLKVTGLKRVRIGNIRLGKLPQGKWRYVCDNEHF